MGNPFSRDSGTAAEARPQPQTQTQSEAQHKTETNGLEQNQNQNENEQGTEGKKKRLTKAEKKQLRQEQLRQKRLAKRQREKELSAQKSIEKRQKREAWLNSLSPEELEAENERKKKTLLKNLEKKEKERAAMAEFMDVKNSKFEIYIDMNDEWNKEMHEKEKKSLVRQIMYCYNSVKMCKDKKYKPIRVTCCGVGDEIKGFLDQYVNGWTKWPDLFRFSPLSIAHHFQQEEEGEGGKGKELIYLTHDADAVLDHLDEKHVYVIGGIVDRNRLKGCTYQKAKQLGIKTMKFNFDFLDLTFECGTKVLTVNHCVDILLHRANGTTWKQAYLNVLPDRKGITQCDKQQKQPQLDTDNVQSVPSAAEHSSAPEQGEQGATQRLPSSADVDAAE